MKKVLYISSLSLSLLASVSFAQDDVIFEADLSTGQPALSAVILAQKVEFPQEGVLRADCLGLSAIECSAAGLSTAADTTAHAGTMATAPSTGTITIMNSGAIAAGAGTMNVYNTGAATATGMKAIATTGSITIHNSPAATASAGGITAIIGNLNLSAGSSYTQTEAGGIHSLLCCFPGNNPAIMDASTLPEYLSNEYLNSPVSLKAGQCLKNLSRVGMFKVICEKTETDVSENVTDSASSVEEPVSSVSDEEAAAKAEAAAVEAAAAAAAYKEEADSAAAALAGEELPVASDAREEL